MAARGLGVSQQDLDASRLVFVSVKDAKPKRKVAVPIPENGSWEAFVSQIASKLKLAGVGELYLAATGERVVRLDQLQDIDELYVIEAASRSGGGNGSAFGGASEIQPIGSNDADAEGKYAKRQGSLQRTAKRMFPSLFTANSLPLTTKDLGLGLSPVEAVRRRARKRRRSWTDPRTILVFFALLSSLGTLIFVYLRAAQGLP